VSLISAPCTWRGVAWRADPVIDDRSEPQHYSVTGLDLTEPCGARQNITQARLIRTTASGGVCDDESSMA